jgi:hypothetical protein
MKRSLCILLSLLTSCVAGAVLGAPALSSDVALDVSQPFSARAIAAVGAEQYCVTGAVYHDEIPNDSAMAMLVDSRRHRVLWKADIPFAKDHFENVATACLRDGDAYYVLTEEHTDSVANRNRTELVVNQLSATGKLIKQRRIDIDANVWANRFEASPDGLSIVGGTSTQSLEQGGKRSVFRAVFDRDLTRRQLTVLPTGAFSSDASAKLDGDSLRIAGQFLPNEGTAASSNDGYAASKIDLRKERYVWSTPVYPLKTEAADAIFLPDGRTAFVGLNDRQQIVSLLDSSGHVANRFAKPKAICGVDALGIKGGAILQVVGKSCKDDHATSMLDIDLATGDVTSLRQVGENASGTLFEDDALVIVSAPAGGGAVLHRTAR